MNTGSNDAIPGNLSHRIYTSCCHRNFHGMVVKLTKHQNTGYVVLHRGTSNLAVDTKEEGAASAILYEN